MPYIAPDLLSDEGAVAQAILEGIRDQIPGWEPYEGHVETAIAEAVAMVQAGIMAQIKSRAMADYEGFGLRVLRLPRHSEQVAAAATDWVLNHQDGAVIPSGSLVVMTPPGGDDPVQFATIQDTVVPAGTATAPGVIVHALEAGPEANGLAGSASSWTQITGVTGVTMTTTSAGGADQEPVEDYVDRVADAARRLHLTPITTQDFAGAALDHPLVARAMAVNLLDPVTTTYPGVLDDEGHITVFPVTAQGTALVAGDKATLLTALAAGDGPLNVSVHVADPTVTVVDVGVTVQAAPGVAAVGLAAAVQAAVQRLLDPAVWAFDRATPGRWRAPATTEDRTVRDYDVAAVAASVPGVVGVDACTLNGGRTVVMSGWAPLPKAGTVTVTVT